MSPPKKSRPDAAQQLIDSLLSDSSPEANGHGQSGGPENMLSLESNPEMHRNLDPVAQAERTMRIEQHNARLKAAANPDAKEPAGPSGIVSGHKRHADDHDAPDFAEFAAEPEYAPSAELLSHRQEESDHATRSLSGANADLSMASGAPHESDESSPRDVTFKVGDAIRDDDMRKQLEELKSLASSHDVSIDRDIQTEVRGARGQVAPSRAMGSPASSAAGVFSSSEAALKQSESLRVAQTRMTELENELDRLRRENEGLLTAGETLRRRMDEFLAKAENIENQAREAQRIFDEEKKVLRGQNQAKERENIDLRSRNEEMEMRLESNFKKIRVRERELEHRLEIVRMESLTLISTKDKMILDLKRQIDQLLHENDYAKQKSQELFTQYKNKQETIRRVVRALRIALTTLEGDEDNVVPMKKAE